MLAKNDALVSTISETIVFDLQQTEFSPVDLISTLEPQLKELFRQVGMEVCEQIYNQAGRQVVGQAREVGFCVQSNPMIPYGTVFGMIQIESPYLYNRKKKVGKRPLREHLRITARGKSDCLEQAISSFGAEESFQQAAKRFQEHYGWAVSKSSTREITLRRAEQCEKYVEDRLGEGHVPRKNQGAKEMLLELDGCNLRTGRLIKLGGSQKTEIRELPKKKRLEEYRECRVGLARQLQEVDKTYVAGMKSYREVVGQMVQAAQSRGLTEQTEVIAVSDGGNGLKEELEVQFDGLHFILDYYHLSENLYEGAEALEIKGKEKKDWVDEKLALVGDGKAEQVIEMLRREYRESQCERVERLAGYLERFKDCVHYKEYKEKGFPIGSGEIESAHRILPQKRMKLPGAWWLEENINPMLALRVVRVNGWWKDFWDSQRNQDELAY